MRHWLNCRWVVLGLLVVAGALAAARVCAEAPSPAVGQMVEITVAGDTVVSGILREQTDTQVVIEEQSAGGTIITSRRIPRSEVVSMRALDQAELAARSMATAHRGIGQYQLNASRSYPAAYYQQVIDNQLRPFLQAYPDSPYAAEVRQKLERWQAEYRQVASGQAKYGGQWMDAEEAGRLMAAANPDQLILQARQLYQQGRFAQAIETVRYVEAPGVSDFIRATYAAWLRALDSQRQRALAGIQAARTSRATAEEEKRRIYTAMEGRAGSASPGPTDEEVNALNQLDQQITGRSLEIKHLDDQIKHVRRQLQTVRPLAEKFGVTFVAGQQPEDSAQVVSTAPEGGGSGQMAAEEDWGTPELMRDMIAFGVKYWPHLAAVLVIAIGYATWKFSR